MSRSRQSERELVSEILDRVRRIGGLRSEQEKFILGRTPVRYAGRVYDTAELLNLVESSLEFWLTAGRWHHRLEQGLAQWYGVPHARLVNSGSSANLVAVAALTSSLLGDRRLLPGDEVITVAAAFPTTVAPLIQHGLVPVFVDVTLPTCNLDISALEAALSSKTRAVMVAHTLGNPFDLQTVVDFCEAHRLWLVEDNCDAAGSKYRGRKTGTFGHLATLSFYPPHHMTTGEGGAVLINDECLLRPIESFRDWGKDCWCNSGVDNTCCKRFGWQLGNLPPGYDHKYIFSHLGYNLKMTDLQAAVGCAQLNKLDGFVTQRRENWAFFRAEFTDLQEFFVLPEETANAEPSWFGFMLAVKKDAQLSRDMIVAHLESKKIQTRMLFAGNIVRQPALTTLAADAAARNAAAPYRIAGHLDQTDRVMNDAFWFGVYPGLTEQMRSFVAAEVRSSVYSSAAAR